MQTIKNIDGYELFAKFMNLANKLFESMLRWKWLWLSFLSALLVFNYFFTLGINVSQSLPESLFLIHKNDHSFSRGDYISFRWHGGGPYQPGVKFTKIVRGVPGDVVTIIDQKVYINGEYVSTAKKRATTGQPLEIGPTGIIPPGSYYVHGTHKDSLDSRYAMTGWIHSGAVVGKAKPVF